MRMFRAGAAALLVALLAAAGAPAATTWRATPGGWVSGNVEYVTTVATEAGTAVSGTLHERYLYVTTFRSFSIYDVKDPVRPKLVSTRPLGAQLFNEQPETNGRILLLANDFKGVEASVDPLRLRGAGALEIWDVRDKADPRPLATLHLRNREHIWTCVLDCSYAYGAGGAIVDLRDPRAPRIVGDWRPEDRHKDRPTGYHTIQEIAPGLVLTGSAPSLYLDARRDPANPKLLASLQPELSSPGFPSNPSELPAHVAWPSEGENRYLLMSMETPFGGACDKTSGGFRTYDTRGWEGGKRISLADEYTFSTDDGTYTNGRSAHHVWGCSAYAFDIPGDHGSTGRVAVAWFEDGVRSLRVAGDGSITEVGGFLPLGGSSSTPLWRNDEVLYVIDLYRGIDILRVGRGR